LKIDQTFVQDSTTDPDDAAIVSAVISLGRSLRQRVIAEGVETREQLAFLKKRLCDEGQGYYIGRPMVADEFAALLGALSRPAFESKQAIALSAR
jgi:EAL domain-containing protein (putative c-di-GMP-specific phosphodiesterase class I)